MAASIMCTSLLLGAHAQPIVHFCPLLEKRDVSESTPRHILNTNWQKRRNRDVSELALRCTLNTALVNAWRVAYLTSGNSLGFHRNSHLSLYLGCCQDVKLQQPTHLHNPYHRFSPFSPWMIQMNCHQFYHFICTDQIILPNYWGIHRQEQGALFSEITNQITMLFYFG